MKPPYEPFRPGDRCGPYRILRELGRGGMAVVYLGEKPGSEPRAIKVLQFDRLSRSLADRFQAEIRVLAMLDNAHVVRFYDAGRHRDAQRGEVLWLAIQYLEGKTLRELLDEQPRGLRLDVAARIAMHMADGLAALHRCKVIHRDVKPENAMILGGEVKLFDLGVLKSDWAGARTTETGMVVGTPSYMAPEQLSGDEPVGPAADIYALGLVLHEMCTGRHPLFSRDRVMSPHEMVFRAIFDVPPPLSDLVPGCPDDLSAIAARALAKRPAERFHSMEAMRDALNRALMHLRLVQHAPSLAAIGGDWSPPVDWARGNTSSAAEHGSDGSNATLLIAAAGAAARTATERIAPSGSTENATADQETRSLSTVRGDSSMRPEAGARQEGAARRYATGTPPTVVSAEVTTFRVPRKAPAAPLSAEAGEVLPRAPVARSSVAGVELARQGAPRLETTPARRRRWPVALQVVVGALGGALASGVVLQGVRLTRGEHGPSPVATAVANSGAAEPTAASSAVPPPVAGPPVAGPPVAGTPAVPAQADLAPGALDEATTGAEPVASTTEASASSSAPARDAPVASASGTATPPNAPVSLGPKAPSAPPPAPRPPDAGASPKQAPKPPSASTAKSAPKPASTSAPKPATAREVILIE